MEERNDYQPSGFAICIQIASEQWVTLLMWMETSRANGLRCIHKRFYMPFHLKLETSNMAIIILEKRLAVCIVANSINKYRQGKMDRWEQGKRICILYDAVGQSVPMIFIRKRWRIINGVLLSVTSVTISRRTVQCVPVSALYVTLKNWFSNIGLHMQRSVLLYMQFH